MHAEQGCRERTWVPAAVAAAVIVDFVPAPAEGPVIELVAPQSVPWETIATPRLVYTRL